jgi:hypothetical protein
MSTKKENAAIIGVGAVACAACCAGPIIGFLGALGLLAGVAMFGTIGLAAAAIVVLVTRRRRRQSDACTPTDASSAVVKIMPRSTVRPRS